jgi:fimbrial chaperone protein
VWRWLLGAVLLLLAPSRAGSVSVAPVLLDVTAPAAATLLTLRNDQTRPLNVQVRVYRWQQDGGEEKLVPTREVVVSPPIATMQPRGEQVVRVLRLSKAAPIGEESYRVLVDELPDAVERRDGRVRLVLRHSLPVFFAERALSPPSVTWSIAERGGSWLLEGVNAGGRRLRIANLSVKDAAGTVISYRSGLMGYVLAGGRVRWPLGPARGLRMAGAATLTADTETGPMHATAPIRVGR